MTLNKLLLAVIVSAAFTSSLYLANFIGKPLPKNILGVQTQVFSITQKIDSGTKAGVSQVIPVTSGDTVLTALSKSQKVITKVYSFGTSVESINEVTSGTNNKYWIYYVNSQMANIGADRYSLKPGDLVEWKFEASK